MASHFTLATEGQILTADYSTCVHSINQNNNCFFFTSVLVKVVVMSMQCRPTGEAYCGYKFSLAICSCLYRFFQMTVSLLFKYISRSRIDV